MKNLITRISRRRMLQLSAGAATFTLATPALAQRKNGPGVTDTEIKLGQCAPYSGPVSALGVAAKASIAYFAWVNDRGGVNGRKVNIVSLDDGYSPPKTVEQTRKLVEQENVFAMFNSIGTPTNMAVIKYLHERKVPMTFIGAGAPQFFDPVNAPLTIPWQPNYIFEGAVWAKHILQHVQNPKVAVLSQNDDFGRSLVKGFKDALGSGGVVVAEQTYETSDPSLDTQIIALAKSNASVLVNVSTPKFAALSIRKVFDLGWRPVHYVQGAAATVDAVLEPAGLEKSVGLLSAGYQKDPSDPAFAQDPYHDTFVAWHKKYLPEAKISEFAVTMGFNRAYTMHQALERCGQDLSRENLLEQATSLKDLQIPMIMDGILFNTSKTDYSGIRSFRMMKFDGKRWIPEANVIKA